VNIVRRHWPPCLTSGSQLGPISRHGNGPGFRTSRTEPEGNPWSGHDRNECTLQANGVQVFARSVPFTTVLGACRLGALPNARVMGEVNAHRFEGTQALDRGHVLLRQRSGGCARDRGVRPALPLGPSLERLAGQDDPAVNRVDDQRLVTGRVARAGNYNWHCSVGGSQRVADPFRRADVRSAGPARRTRQRGGT
jgi:hypothetical protein